MLSRSSVEHAQASGGACRSSHRRQLDASRCLHGPVRARRFFQLRLKVKELLIRSLDVFLPFRQCRSRSWLPCRMVQNIWRHGDELRGSAKSPRAGERCTTQILTGGRPAFAKAGPWARGKSAWPATTRAPSPADSVQFQFCARVAYFVPGGAKKLKRGGGHRGLNPGSPAPKAGMLPLHHVPAKRKIGAGAEPRILKESFLVYL